LLKEWLAALHDFRNWLTREAALLYGFRPDYLATVAAVSLILTAVATLACFVPARRASLIDPMIALRQE
jgi:ABC-type lipoprotein release transport system permease subunit